MYHNTPYVYPDILYNEFKIIVLNSKYITIQLLVFYTRATSLVWITLTTSSFAAAHHVYTYTEQQCKYTHSMSTLHTEYTDQLL